LAEVVANGLVEAWREGREADIAYGATLRGPHRDDVELTLDGQGVRAFASQGEQRTCALAVRMGLAARMREMTGERPALLLDDVLSELDERRREGVFAAAGGAEQVIITCCDVEDVPGEVRRSAEVVEIRDGEARRE
jgi:DNA replication and repair protein RecF